MNFYSQRRFLHQSTVAFAHLWGERYKRNSHLALPGAYMIQTMESWLSTVLIMRAALKWHWNPLKELGQYQDWAFWPMICTSMSWRISFSSLQKKQQEKLKRYRDCESGYGNPLVQWERWGAEKLWYIALGSWITASKTMLSTWVHCSECMWMVFRTFLSVSS